MSTSPKIVPFPEIERITQDADFDSNLIDAIAEGFVDFFNGKFNVCPIQTIGAPPMARLSGGGGNHDDDNYSAQVCIKSGYVTGDPYFIVKVAAGGHPLPQNTGLMQVYSQLTGRLEALLLDEGILTELRTAAAGAVAVKYLGPAYVNRIGIVGTGVQARYQLWQVSRPRILAQDVIHILRWRGNSLCDVTKTMFSRVGSKRSTMRLQTVQHSSCTLYNQPDPSSCLLNTL